MFYLFRALLAAFFSFVICFIFYKRRNLDKTGAILAFFCGLFLFFILFYCFTILFVQLFILLSLHSPW